MKAEDGQMMWRVVNAASIVLILFTLFAIVCSGHSVYTAGDIGFGSFLHTLHLQQASLRHQQNKRLWCYRFRICRLCQVGRATAQEHYPMVPPNS